jgi:ParB family chromosome partitioning protein
MSMAATVDMVDPESLTKNPNNPRRFFNEERLDILKTSLQEVGVLVPLIVYRSADDASRYVLMDGERRWRCALDLAFSEVPVNIIAKPSPLDNLLRMFNIHNVRDDWPLISVALSLKEVMQLSGESGEKRLAEITGLTRATVRRAKRILSLPDDEIELIQGEAHLDRHLQVHREDLYLEIEAAESVLMSALPELRAEFDRPEVIRRFAEKAESDSLNAVTDFRYVGRLVKAADDDIVGRDIVLNAARELVRDPQLSPKTMFERVAAQGYKQQTVQRKAELLFSDLLDLASERQELSQSLARRLRELRTLLDEMLEDAP